jgi:putative hemolysin
MVTEDELMTMLSLGVEEGEVEKQERDIIERVFAFNDIIVKEVMTPKKEFFMLEANKTLKSVAKYIMNEGFSRIPVFEKNKIIGIVYVRDMLSTLVSGKVNTKLKDIMVHPHIIPEDKILDDLFREFQETRMHMALVVNEYGDVTGLVTMEDLLEEIVGDIHDETDEEDEKIREIKKNYLIVDATTKIKEIESNLGIKIAQNNKITIAKFVLKKLGKVPKKDTEIKFPKIKVTITKADNYSIKEVKISKNRKKAVHVKKSKSKTKKLKV